MSETIQQHLSPVMRIEDGWVDYNGHLNQAYYGVLFDRAIDDALMPAGLGPDYIKERNCSYMTVESHTCFIRELMQTDPVRVASRVLDVDDKRLHVFCELRHANDGWIAATAEYMFLHIDILHLAGNMLYLWIFGPAVEDRLRVPGFLGLYLLTGLDHSRSEDLGLRIAVEDARLCHGIKHALRLVGMPRERLGADHRLAGLREANRGLFMEMVG